MDRTVGEWASLRGGPEMGGRVTSFHRCQAKNKVKRVVRLSIYLSTKDNDHDICMNTTSLYKKSNSFCDHQLAYGVYTFQLIRYFRACFTMISLITRRLLNQGLLVGKFKSSFQKFYDRQDDLVNRFRISVSQMTMYMFRLS